MSEPQAPLGTVTWPEGCALTQAQKVGVEAEVDRRLRAALDSGELSRAMQEMWERGSAVVDGMTIATLE